MLICKTGPSYMYEPETMNFVVRENISKDFDKSVQFQ